MELTKDGKKEMMLWLNTFSVPQALRDNPDSREIELDMIEEALVKNDATIDSRVRAVFHHIKETMDIRIWPNAKQITDAANNLRRSTAEGSVKHGDRSSLSIDEQMLLEQVIDTARRWLSIPELKQKGQNTLTFWGEEY